MAVFPVAPGHPNYGSDGTSKFIPTVWSTKLIVKFYKATVFGEISNTDYEGEITKHGDKVIIRTTPDVEIKTYVKGQKLVYDTYESANVELKIDKGKYFGFRVDSVDRRQADIKFIDKWSEDAAQQMKISIDRDVINNIYSSVATSNKGTTAGYVSSSYDMGATTAPVALTKNNIVDKIVDMGSVLSERDIPESGRWVVLPTWAVNYLKKSEIKDASLTGDGTSVLRNGRVGMIDTFTIYSSNNYIGVSDTAGGVAVTAYHVLFGHKAATTFAAQMTEMDTLRDQDTFADLVRGLNVYGYEVIKGEAMGDFYCYKG